MLLLYYCYHNLGVSTRFPLALPSHKQLVADTLGFYQPQAECTSNGNLGFVEFPVIYWGCHLFMRQKFYFSLSTSIPLFWKFTFSGILLFDGGKQGLLCPATYFTSPWLDLNSIIEEKLSLCFGVLNSSVDSHYYDLMSPFLFCKHFKHYENFVLKCFTESQRQRNTVRPHLGLA